MEPLTVNLPGCETESTLSFFKYLFIFYFYTSSHSIPIFFYYTIRITLKIWYTSTKFCTSIFFIKRTNLVPSVSSYHLFLILFLCFWQQFYDSHVSAETNSYSTNILLNLLSFFQPFLYSLVLMQVRYCQEK
jgi:hypothetical protein